MVISSVRRGVAIWLSAILICLSFAASAHSVQHIDDGAQGHCTLCFHQHQLNKLLPSSLFNFPVSVPTFEVVNYQACGYRAAHVNVFRSRAPPVQHSIKLNS
ncbi:ABC-type zinc uptake system zinc chaperone [Shewanella atlantica]|uniref:ABC-type zinc uptake system zinc chaperone n=1 Tax=Shewanella atlantica TaxID=271099 RepID=A0A431W6R3_9GAMM|nr:ABC-type zinc uptake system zinc chaperone [Shewanella atlantica]RTR31179.1 ABC-type zinc uptake system zinc chaperone [Shewanella atlantica]